MAKKSKAKKVFGVIGTVILILLIVLVVMSFIARASGNSLSIFGVRLYRVASGSMEPTLKTGDVIVVGKTPIEDIKKGDIVTYKANQGEMAGQPVTHRVIVSPYERDGTIVLQTQGDAEGAMPDPEITSSQIIGKYQFTIPLVGYFYSFFLTPQGLITIVVVIIALFGFEMISLLLSYRSLDKTYEDYLETTKKEVEEKIASESAQDDENET